jgi:hypothetical protein
MSAALVRNEFNRWECAMFERTIFSFFNFFLPPHLVAVQAAVGAKNPGKVVQAEMASKARA